MNMSAGTGNIGVYSIKAGTIENRNGVITVGGSVPGEDEYGIGMAAGYTWTKKDLLKPISQRPEQTTGNIVNRGTINVNGQYSMVCMVVEMELLLITMELLILNVR